MLLFTQRFVPWYLCCFSRKGRLREKHKYQVTNLKLLISRKHTEDVLVFFSQMDINGKKLYVDEEMEEEWFALFKVQIFF